MPGHPMHVTGFPLQAMIFEPRVWPKGDLIRGPQPNDMLDIQTHRLEKPVTKQQRCLKLSRENNSSASAKLSGGGGLDMPVPTRHLKASPRPPFLAVGHPQPISSQTVTCTEQAAVAQPHRLDVQATGSLVQMENTA